MSERVYVVTDIEVDGFVPGANSMLALASVAVTASGEQVGEFEAVLAGSPAHSRTRRSGRGSGRSRPRCWRPPRRTRGPWPR